MFKVWIALEMRRCLFLHVLCHGCFKLFHWGSVHIPKQRGKNTSFPEIKVKRHGTTILLFAFKTEGVWFMSAWSLCHSCAGAAVECDPHLIPITTPGIDHISFVVTDCLPRGLLVSEPSHLASRPANAWCKNIVFSVQPEIDFVIRVFYMTVFMLVPLWPHLKSPINSPLLHYEFFVTSDITFLFPLLTNTSSQYLL